MDVSFCVKIYFNTVNVSLVIAKCFGAHFFLDSITRCSSSSTNSCLKYRQEIWANAHGTRDSISLISYAGCLGLSPVYFSENLL